MEKIIKLLTICIKYDECKHLKKMKQTDKTYHENLIFIISNLVMEVTLIIKLVQSEYKIILWEFASTSIIHKIRKLYLMLMLIKTGHPSTYCILITSSKMRTEKNR